MIGALNISVFEFWFKTDTVIFKRLFRCLLHMKKLPPVSLICAPKHVIDKCLSETLMLVLKEETGRMFRSELEKLRSDRDKGADTCLF